jgi:hypothetical protein
MQLQLCFNALRHNFLLTLISKFSPYLIGNTLRLRDKGQVINSKNHMKLINTLCGKV